MTTLTLPRALLHPIPHLQPFPTQGPFHLLPSCILLSHCFSLLVFVVVYLCMPVHLRYVQPCVGSFLAVDSGARAWSPATLRASSAVRSSYCLAGEPGAPTWTWSCGCLTCAPRGLLPCHLHLGLWHRPCHLHLGLRHSHLTPASLLPRAAWRRPAQCAAFPRPARCPAPVPETVPTSPSARCCFPYRWRSLFSSFVGSSPFVLWFSFFLYASFKRCQRFILLADSPSATLFFCTHTSPVTYFRQFAYVPSLLLLPYSIYSVHNPALFPIQYARLLVPALAFMVACCTYRCKLWKSPQKSSLFVRLSSPPPG